MHENVIVDKIKNGKSPLFPSHVRGEFREITEMCLRSNASKRPTASVVLQYIRKLGEDLFPSGNFSTVYASICEKIGDAIQGDYDWKEKRFRIGKRGIYYNLDGDGVVNYPYTRISETVYLVEMGSETYILVYIVEDNMLETQCRTSRNLCIARTRKPKSEKDRQSLWSTES